MPRCFALLLAAFACSAQDAVIRMEDGVFRVAGWTATAPPAGGWESVLSVNAGEGDVPSLLGSYTVENGVLTFRPRFPIAGGMKVRARFTPAAGAPVEANFEIPKATLKPPTTRVVQVYPTTDLIPENQLKFYIYFSAPMQRGEAWSRIHLLQQDGTPVDLPFLEIDQELWDRDSTRLTVLFDPGRIKRGLLPLEEVGPAIEEGKSYTLVIDRKWVDGSGVPLAEGFRKSFRVGPADRDPIDPAKWKLTPPRAGTTDPLVIEFPESLDFALLQHYLQISGVSGTVAVDRHETHWSFTPTQTWKPVEYKLVVRTMLEDLAGNHVGRRFDIDIFDKVDKTVSRETVSIPFRPRR